MVKREFIINRQGKDFVLYAGLLDAAHEDGLKQIKTTIVQLPTSENGQTAVCTAEVVTERGVFTGIGDADHGNVSRMMIPHLLRMAETRAKARALRDAINVGVTAFEELGDQGVDGLTGDDSDAEGDPRAGVMRASTAPRQREPDRGQMLDRARETMRGAEATARQNHPAPAATATATAPAAPAARTAPPPRRAGGDGPSPTQGRPGAAAAAAASRRPTMAVPDHLRDDAPPPTPAPEPPTTANGATPRQIETIKRMARAGGKSMDVPEGLTRGQASEIINGLIEAADQRPGTAATAPAPEPDGVPVEPEPDWEEVKMVVGRAYTRRKLWDGYESRYQQATDLGLDVPDKLTPHLAHEDIARGYAALTRLVQAHEAEHEPVAAGAPSPT